METLKRTNKKPKYSCLEKNTVRFENPVEKLTRWGRNLRYMYQRVRYGYCDRDIWMMDDWFLSVIPNMLDELKQTRHGFPSALLDEQDMNPDKEANERCDKEWGRILSEMAHCFREANERTCTRKNPYEDEWDKVSWEFYERYGTLGEKLMTEEEIKENKRMHVTTVHLASELPENRELWDKYTEEMKKIDEYQRTCTDQGMELLRKWIRCLWD